MFIGITGYTGAGKGVVVDYLVAHHGFKHFSIRAFLTEEITRRGLPLNRDTMGAIADEFRENNGPLAGLMMKGVSDSDNVILESIRSLMEARYIKEHGGEIWAITADVHTRFERIRARGTDLDNVSFEEFMVSEKAESANPEPFKMNIIAVMALADVSLTNDGTQEELYAQIETALQNE